MKKLFYSQKLAPYVFILPFVLTVIFFWAVPIANGVLLSFQDVLQDKCCFNRLTGFGDYISRQRTIHTGNADGR